MYAPKSSLSADEKQLKTIVRAILVRAHLLQNNTESAWNDFATRHVLHDPKIMEFANRFLKGPTANKPPEAPAPEAPKEKRRGGKAAKRPSASPGSPGSGKKGRSRTPSARSS